MRLVIDIGLIVLPFIVPAVGLPISALGTADLLSSYFENKSGWYAFLLKLEKI